MTNVDFISKIKEKILLGRGLELPSQEEMDEGRRNLLNHENSVDFIITHCCSSSTQALLGRGFYTTDIETKYLEEIKQTVIYKKWFSVIIMTTRT